MTMSLQQKGRIRPPPVLAEPFERVSRTVRSWPDVVAATHWYLYDRERVDGADFYVGEEELGHLHLDGEMHLATTAGLARALIARGLAARFPYDAGWVAASIETEADADRVLWLFRLNYDRLRGVPLPVLQERIFAYEKARGIRDTLGSSRQSANFYDAIDVA